MSTAFQVAVDCADPHRLAAFWAAALGYEVEDNAEFIERMLAEGQATEDDVTTVDGRRAWRTGAACNDPVDGRARLYFQLVPEPKAVKNRVHLDLRVDADRHDEEVERLTALGASRIGEGQQGPHSWIVMADPEGNEFCVT